MARARFCPPVSVKSNTGACLRSPDAETSFKQLLHSLSHGKKNIDYRSGFPKIRLANRACSACIEIFGEWHSLSRKSPGILRLRDIFQYLPSVSVPGLALQALILHYINKGLKNQGCYGKQIGVVEASRYSANTLALPSLSIFLLYYVFHLPAKRYYTSGVEK